MSEVTASMGLCTSKIKSDFINTINRVERQLIEVAFAPPGTSKYNRAVYLEKFSLEILDLLISSNKNIAFLGGLSKEKLKTVVTNVESNRIGGDQYMLMKSIVSFDLDFKDNAPVYNLETKQQIKIELIEKILHSLKTVQLSPWIISLSGNGVHIHFKFSEPIKIGTIQRYRGCYETLRSYLECITGLKFDPSCSNPSRLMRLPFSTNWKDSNNPIPCEILHYNEANDALTIWPTSMECNENIQYNDKKKILPHLNLIKILEHFGYSKMSSLKDQNGRIICSSPFSNDSNPSFYYDANRKIFYDFSASFGGDMFTLIAKLGELNDKKEFPQVLVLANKIANIQENKTQNIDTGFIVNEKGVWFQSAKESDPHWLSTPIYVDALTRDHTGKSWGRLLTFTDQDNLVKRWAMPMELLAGDGTDIRKHLLSLGAQMAINYKDRQLFLTYLQTARPQKRALCVQRIGWHQHHYVLPDRVFTKDKDTQQIILQSREKDQDFSCLNSLKEWQNNVGIYCKGNSRLIFALGASFAAPLLKITNEESGGFHFVGQSSIGKTITLKIAASIWGGPGLNGFIKRWRSTLNGLEILAASRCDSLLILDELGEIKAQDAGNAAYLLSAGVSKNRATKNTLLATQLEWRVVFLSSGEITLATHMEHSGEKATVGQEVRMIDLPALAKKSMGIFEDIHGFENSSTFANMLSSNSEQFYGSPIIHFLEKLTTDSLASSKIEKYKEEFVNHCEAVTYGQMHRVLKRFALVAAAGELAIEYGILPWPVGECINAVSALFTEWKEAWGNGESREFQGLISQIKGLFQEFGPSRFPLLQTFKSDPMNHHQKLWGFRVEHETEQEWIILSEVFRNIFCKGHDYRWATAQLKHHDFITRPSSTMRVPHLGVTRVITFSGKIIE